MFNSFGDNANEVWRSETEKTAFVKLCVCSAFKLCELPCSFIVGVEWIPGASYILTRKVLGPGIQPLQPLRTAGGLQCVYMMVVVVVTFSSLLRILGECSAIHSTPALFFLFLGGD